MRTIAILLIGFCTLLTGCATEEPPSPANWAAVGAAGGGAIGATTGAVIGATIPNGIIGASALLGGAIGIPVGAAIMASIAYEKNSEQTEMDDHIERNRQLISERSAEIERLRRQVQEEGFPPQDPNAR